LSPVVSALPSRRSFFLLDDFPRIVCFCGSTRFKDAWLNANRDETLSGKIVLSVGLLGHQEGLDMNGPVKVALDQLHLRKIDLADEVLVLNCGGYIGESTRREIAYAQAHGKPVRYLEPLPEAVP
jgi:hypothetical protein